MSTWPPRVFESAQCPFNVALRSALERIVTTSGPGFSDWQWRLITLPFAFGGLGIYSTGDVLNYAFLALRLQSAVLQTKLLRHVGIVAYGFTFDDALSVFNNSMEIDFLSNPCEIAAPKLMKKMTDIYFTRVTKDAISTFSLSSRQMALWKSQMEDHTSDWLRAVDFVPGRANDAVTLLKRIQKFSVTQDIGARTAIHIFNRTGFAIVKGVEAQIVFTPGPNSQFALPNDETFGTFDECNSQYSNDNNESKSDVGDDSDDGSEVAAQSHSQGVMDYMNGVGDASDDDTDDKFLEVNGLKVHIAEIGNETSPVVVFVHGFPEIWYSWRHQMIDVANAGYRAIALDCRGYGLSDPPPDTEKFGFSDIVDDLLAIVDSLVCKDAGTRPTYMFALRYPTRVTGVISIGIPHAPSGSPGWLKELPEGFYINRWREPGRAEADFGRLDAKTVVRNIYILFSRNEIPIASENQEIMDIVEPSTPLPSWLTEEDLSAYGALYEKSGFLNALKVPYRSLEEEYGTVDPVIKNPMLLIIGEKDYFFKFPGVDDYVKSGMVKHFASDLEIEYVPEGSHFVQEQFPDKINQLILRFLSKLK
ncbi:bifunctional epoxide hydrolase 2-like protein [Tanacetum coccineum]